jgi:hypothetical protein
VEQIAPDDRRLARQLSAAGQAARFAHHAQVPTSNAPAEPERLRTTRSQPW